MIVTPLSSQSPSIILFPTLRWFGCSKICVSPLFLKLVSIGKRQVTNGQNQPHKTNGNEWTNKSWSGAPTPSVACIFSNIINLSLASQLNNLVKAFKLRFWFFLFLFYFFFPFWRMTSFISMFHAWICQAHHK